MPVLAVVGGLLVAGLALDACTLGSDTPGASPGSPAAAGPPGPSPAPPGSPAARQAAEAARATATFTAQSASATAALVSQVAAVGADLTRGDRSAAQADELAAQAAFDRFRALEAPNPVNAGSLDGLDTEVPPGGSLTGLHALERDLWAGGPADQDVADLTAQATVAQFLLSRNRLNPGPICRVAVDELSWTAGAALATSQERYSHRGLVDVAATVGAATDAEAAISPLARDLRPALAADVERRLAAVAALVAALGPPDQVADTTALAAVRLPLTRAIDAAAAPLARLCGALAPFGSAGALS